MTIFLTLTPMALNSRQYLGNLYLGTIPIPLHATITMHILFE